MSSVCGGLVRRVPLVAVVGATGTGKTKLGVELARAFPAEIISADSMQVYRGLDVITAKASAAERAAAPHHLLDLLDPPDAFTVLDFRNRALPIIENLMENGKIPIVVGGTHYYVESLLWKILVQDIDDSEELMCERDKETKRKRKLEESETNPPESEGSGVIDQDLTSSPKFHFKSGVDCESFQREAEQAEKVPADDGKETASEAAKGVNSGGENEPREDTVEKETGKETGGEEAAKGAGVDRDAVRRAVESGGDAATLYAMLRTVDPAMADRLHVNNRRKVQRALEVWLDSGRRFSEVLAEQAARDRQLRYKGNTVVLWLKCEQTEHDARLDARVDSMLAAGLVQEMLDYHERYNRSRLQADQPPDYTKGIFQTVGFKEFHDYLTLEAGERAAAAGRALLARGVRDTKLGTRRLARRQAKMVRARFLDHPTREIPPVFELDTTDLTKWDENVKDKAVGIVRSFLDGTPCPCEPLAPSESAADKTSADIHSHNRCEECERVFIGDIQYRIHMRSNRHKRVLQRLKKQAEKAIPE